MSPDTGLIFRELTMDNWSAVRAIWTDGIATANATFEAVPPGKTSRKTPLPSPFTSTTDSPSPAPASASGSWNTCPMPANGGTHYW
jgi:hypothetical protein